MKTIEEHLRFLASEIAHGYGTIVTYDHVNQWPKGRLPELMKMGILIETPPGSSIVCHECDADCSVEPQIVQYPDGRSVGLFFCREQSHSVEVPMDHFKRWEVLPTKLHELGYRVPVPDEELTNEQVVELLGGGISVGTITKWCQKGVFKDNGKSGREHRVIKSSVLLYKQEVDRQKEIDDALEKARLEKGKSRR